MISTADLMDAWRDLDRRSRLWCGYALIALLAVAMGWSALAAGTAGLERKRAAREAVLKELLRTLSGQFLSFNKENGQYYLKKFESKFAPI